MGWFSKKRGIDENVLRKTKYWNEVEAMIQTDQETYKRLVQYIYEQVSDGIIAELLRAEQSDPISSQYLRDRAVLLKSYKELAYKKEDTNGS